jgi:hypothetical protein
MRSSKGGAPSTGSERPVPRLSHTMYFIETVRCSATMEKMFVGSS